MKILHWLKNETIKVLPAIIYFFFAFNLAYFTIGLVLPPGFPRLYTYGGVTIAAIVMGKIIIVAESLPFLNAFPNPPLIYNIIWKTILYNIIVSLFRILESFVHIAWHYGFTQSTIDQAMLEITSPIFWAIGIVMGIFFFFFVVFGEFVRVLGKRKVTKAIFSRSR